jgi:hypothetical protein
MLLRLDHIPPPSSFLLANVTKLCVGVLLLGFENLFLLEQAVFHITDNNTSQYLNQSFKSLISHKSQKYLAGISVILNTQSNKYTPLIAMLQRTPVARNHSIKLICTS